MTARSGITFISCSEADMEPRWIDDLMRQQERDEAENERALDLALVCPNCNDEGHLQCPGLDIDPDGHSEPDCPYECVDGEVDCICTTEGYIRPVDPDAFDPENLQPIRGEQFEEDLEPQE